MFYLLNPNSMPTLIGSFTKFNIEPFSDYLKIKSHYSISVKLKISTDGDGKTHYPFFWLFCEAQTWSTLFLNTQSYGCKPITQKPKLHRHSQERHTNLTPELLLTCRAHRIWIHGDYVQKVWVVQPIWSQRNVFVRHLRVQPVIVIVWSGIPHRVDWGHPFRHQHRIIASLGWPLFPRLFAMMAMSVCVFVACQATDTADRDFWAILDQSHRCLSFLRLPMYNCHYLHPRRRAARRRHLHLSDWSLRPQWVAPVCWYWKPVWTMNDAFLLLKLFCWLLRGTMCWLWLKYPLFITAFDGALFCCIFVVLPGRYKRRKQFLIHNESEITQFFLLFSTRFFLAS